jgi:aminoglycoside 3-N-acetyltransferase
VSLLETLSGLAVRYLSQDRINVLRNAYFSSRAKLYPLLNAVYGTFGAADLRAHLEERIGRDFDILMVHSSVNHMQPMYTDGPLELVRMLMAFCGPDKTLAMPAFYFGDPAVGGVVATFRQNSRFDLKRTPSQMGLATELFRRMPGVVQSRHPVYRVSALGPLAKAMAEGHERCEYPSGIGSPFDFMAKHKTLIIGIGKPFQVLTQVHHAEALMGDEFPVPRGTGERLEVTVVDGKEEVQATLSGRSSLLWRMNIWKLRSIMGKESLREWSYHHVPLFAVRADEVTTALIGAAKRGITLYEKP